MKSMIKEKIQDLVAVQGNILSGKVIDADAEPQLFTYYSRATGVYR